MNDKITAEQYFENYKFSYWIFVVATTVIMGNVIGGAGASILLSPIYGYFFGSSTSDEAIICMLIGMAIVFFTSVFPSIFHIHTGKRKYAKIHKYCIFVHFALYCLSLFFVKFSDYWGAYLAIIFTLIAYRAMNSSQYQSFLAYAETIRQDWTGWQRCYAKWLTDKFNKFTSK